VAHDKAASLTRMEMHVLVGHVARQLPDPVSPRSEARREPKKAALSTARDKRIGSQDFSYPSPEGAVLTARRGGHRCFVTRLQRLQNRRLDQTGRQNVSLLLAKKRLTPLSFAPDHPSVANALNNLALLYRGQGRYADAEPLHKRSLAIHEKALGPDHPIVAQSLNNLAELYLLQGRYADALPLVRSAAQRGFERKSLYLAVLTGASAKSLVTNADAFNEGYQVVQRATSSAASQAVNQLSVRFAAGSDQLAQLVRRDQDLSSENERLDKLIIEAASKEPSKRDAAKEQEIRARLQLIASERAQIQTTLYQQFPDYAALAKPVPCARNTATSCRRRNTNCLRLRSAELRGSLFAFPGGLVCAANYSGGPRSSSQGFARLTHVCAAVRCGSIV